jgi:hypothetical protein
MYLYAYKFKDRYIVYFPLSQLASQYGFAASHAALLKARQKLQAVSHLHQQVLPTEVPLQAVQPLIGKLCCCHSFSDVPGHHSLKMQPLVLVQVIVLQSRQRRQLKSNFF